MNVFVCICVSWYFFRNFISLTCFGWINKGKKWRLKLSSVDWSAILCETAKNLNLTFVYHITQLWLVSVTWFFVKNNVSVAMLCWMNEWTPNHFGGLSEHCFSSFHWTLSQTDDGKKIDFHYSDFSFFFSS